MGARNAQDTHLQKKNRIYRKKKNELPKNTIITTTEKKRENHTNCKAKQKMLNKV